MLRRIIGLFRKVGSSFLMIVALPTALSVMYFGFIASDIYISESKFIIRAPGRQPALGMGILALAQKMNSASEETHAATEYMQSRSALDDLDREGLATRAYANPSISALDRFGGLWGGTSRERFFEYYGKKAKVQLDSSTFIMTVTVRAFAPKDAQSINRSLLQSTEGLVNRLSARGRSDLVEFAERDLVEAERQAQAASNGLAAYRNQRRIVDPEKQASIALQMIAKLQDELIAARTQLAQLRAFAPRNPQIPVLEQQVRSLIEQISLESAGITGGAGSLAASTPEYASRLLQSQVADKQLAGAIAALQDAKNDGRRKQAYVERISDPSLPDYPVEPRRLRGILATLLVGLLAWAIFRLLTAGIREHMG
jgi:capsular polysaccharide transport system permease protein